MCAPLASTLPPPGDVLISNLHTRHIYLFSSFIWYFSSLQSLAPHSSFHILYNLLNLLTHNPNNNQQTNEATKFTSERHHVQSFGCLFNSCSCSCVWTIICFHYHHLANLAFLLAFIFVCSKWILCHFFHTKQNR